MPLVQWAALGCIGGHHAVQEGEARSPNLRDAASLLSSADSLVSGAWPARAPASGRSLKTPGAWPGCLPGGTLACPCSTDPPPAQINYDPMIQDPRLADLIVEASEGVVLLAYQLGLGGEMDPYAGLQLTCLQAEGNIPKSTRLKSIEKNSAYGRHRISRPMRILGSIQFWRG